MPCNLRILLPQKTSKARHASFGLLQLKIWPGRIDMLETWAANLHPFPRFDLEPAAY